MEIFEIAPLKKPYLIRVVVELDLAVGGVVSLQWLISVEAAGLRMLLQHRVAVDQEPAQSNTVVRSLGTHTKVQDSVWQLY